MAARCALLAVIVLCCLSLTWGRRSPPDNRVEALEITSVTREIDLTSPLVKQKVTMVIENKAAKAVSSVYYTVERQLAKKLAYIGAQVIKNNGLFYAHSCFEFFFRCRLIRMKLFPLLY